MTSCDKARLGRDVIDPIAIADQAGHILVNLVKHDLHFVPSWSIAQFLDISLNRPRKSKSDHWLPYTRCDFVVSGKNRKKLDHTYISPHVKL
jgi:hypothetical protein